MEGEKGDWLDETAGLVHAAIEEAIARPETLCVDGKWFTAYVAAEAIADLLCPDREREVEVLKI